MKKQRFTLAAALLALPLMLTAAVRPAGEPVRLAGGSGLEAMNPVWSPDGSRIAFTAPRYEGLWIMNADGTGLKQITPEPAAGYGFEWSADGEALVTRVARYEGYRRYNAVKVFDVKNDTVRQVTEYRALMPGLPHWAAGDEKIILYGRGKPEVFDSGKPVSLAKANRSRGIAIARDSQIAVSPAGSADLTLITPFEDARILNPVISPDGTRIAFEVMGGHLHVMNTDGTGILDLGPGNRPAWSPDGAYLVYMMAFDDGHQILSSDLFTIRADGSEQAPLTDTNDKLEMNPDWSPDGRFIIFDTMNEGAVYRMEVTR